MFPAVRFVDCQVICLSFVDTPQLIVTVASALNGHVLKSKRLHVLQHFSSDIHVVHFEWILICVFLRERFFSSIQMSSKNFLINLINNLRVIHTTLHDEKLFYL